MRGPRRTAQVDRSRRGASGRDEAPEDIRVWLLGGFSVSVGSRTIEEGEWRLRKAAGLVKLLALTPEHRMHRERVMDLLWPDLDSEAAANNLRYALHVARRTLEPAPAGASRFLCLQYEQITLYPGGTLWVDAEAFEGAAAAARRTREPVAYRAALDLYVGDLLPQDRYEGWAEDRREGLRRLYLTLLLELAELHKEREEPGAAIEALSRVVEKEPSHQGAHLALMRLYTDYGQRERALEQYDRLKEALKELGREPEEAGRRLYQEISAGRFPAVQPPPPSGPSEENSAEPRHNLPAARTSFVGRER